MPALVAVSLYFSREERVPHLNATLMELKLVCGTPRCFLGKNLSEPNHWMRRCDRDHKT